MHNKIGSFSIQVKIFSLIHLQYQFFQRILKNHQLHSQLNHNFDGSC